MDTDLSPFMLFGCENHFVGLLLAEECYVYLAAKTISLVCCRLRNCAFVDFRDEAAANHAHSLLNRFVFPF